MQRRLFVAINLPEDVKKRIFRFAQKEFKDISAVWSAKENLHVTLNFLGNVKEEKIPDLCLEISAAVAGIRSFDVEFSRAEMGPRNKPKKLIWIAGEACRELDALKNSLDAKIEHSCKGKRKFVPHITLGRIKKTEHNKQTEEEEVKKEVKFAVPIFSVELLESVFEKGKRVYRLLQSFPLA